MNKKELLELTEGKEKESEFLITAEVADEHEYRLGWIEDEKIGCHPGGNSGERGLKLHSTVASRFRSYVTYSLRY